MCKQKNLYIEEKKLRHQRHKAAKQMKGIFVRVPYQDQASSGSKKWRRTLIFSSPHITEPIGVEYIPLISRFSLRLWDTLHYYHLFWKAETYIWLTQKPKQTDRSKMADNAICGKGVCSQPKVCNLTSPATMTDNDDKPRIKKNISITSRAISRSSDCTTMCYSHHRQWS